MEYGEIIGSVLGTLLFAAWVPCLWSWIRKGVTIPRYVHATALVSASVGVGCLLALVATGAATLGLGLALATLPAPATYFGWFWMFGPELSKEAASPGGAGT